jgi:hypothetical protein
MKFLQVEMILKSHDVNPSAIYYLPENAIAFMRTHSKDVYIITVRSEFIKELPPNFKEFKFSVAGPQAVLTL